MKHNPILSGLAAVALVVVAALPARAQSAPVERTFAAGGTVKLDLSAGEYRIRGTASDRIRITWEADDPDDEVSVTAEVTGTNAVVRASGPKDGFHVSIELPRRSHLVVNLSAGDLQVTGVDGNKDISAWAGDLNIEVGDQALYRRVNASVRIGELDAAAFNVKKEGFLRSFDWTGKGTFDLRATLTVGEITLAR